METKPEVESVKIDANLRRKGMMNSGILALQFGALSIASYKSGSVFFAIVGLLATIGTINDALSFYYANKEK